MNIKRILPTLMVLAVFLALWGYASSEDYFQEKPEKKEGTPLFKGLKPGEITSIAMEEKGKVRWKLDREEGKWMFKEPRPLPVDPVMVESWVQSFTELKGVEVVQKHPDAPGKYGLDQPQKRYRVTLENGKNILLAVGDSLPVEDGRYIRKDGKGPILRIGTGEIGFLDKKPLHLMKKEVVQVQEDLIKVFSVRWEESTLKAKKKKDDWKLENGKDAHDPDKLDGLFTDLTMLKAENLARPADDFKNGDPELEMEFTSEKGKKVLFYGNRKDDQVWIWKKEGKWAYPVAVSSVEDAIKEVKKKKEEK
ncbi:uncharacterized protein DUF4340 [Melghirimyces profundicolus]|uniref:Uncharacterized protein DUF4340 n=1 Tax=Melghirimyces profundicolus TaxID=1242148 RepID=A0A2T6C0I6_9BACL|nr:DUF4340 domain-containing protein [Melghirimyces profundicolus]PTX61821.1 uncharacterized protein DUF4340 [Melghirimyces profundicolus]